MQDEEIVPENLDSVGQIAAYVDSKQSRRRITGHRRLSVSRVSSADVRGATADAL